MWLFHLTVTLHVLAAMVWLGGMFFLALVGAPVLRRVDSAPLRAILFRRLGERFRTVGWSTIVVLLVTGIANLHYRGLLGSSVLASATFWRSRYGQFLAIKLACVLIMVTLSAIHDFVLGPAAARAESGSARALAVNRRAAWIARLNVLVGVLLVMTAVRLTRGG